ncbi:hypothetical protein BKA82DRAFT_1008589, partial [Pisolithus tinctorius]
LPPGLYGSKRERKRRRYHRGDENRDEVAVQDKVGRTAVVGWVTETRGGPGQ